jgi:hypothetical protein
MRVTDHDDLGVGPLGGNDALEDRVGVLGFIQQEVVGPDPWLGQRPHLQVVVVSEADDAGMRCL